MYFIYHGCRSGKRSEGITGLVQAHSNRPVTTMSRSRGKIIGAKYFPFPTARPGQKQLMKDVSAVLRSGKHLIAHAPTGIGKTVAVLTPAVAWCKVRGARLLFLTSKHSQHHMAVETLRMIAKLLGDLTVLDIISREKMCPHTGPGTPVPPCRDNIGGETCPNLARDSSETVRYILRNVTHVEDIIEEASRAGVCPHRSALLAAAEADVVVCDYNYIFSSIREVVLARMDLELSDSVLVIDEAHNLPDRIRENASSKLTAGMIREAVSECSRLDDALSYYIRDVGQVLADAGVELSGKVDDAGEVEIKRERLSHGLNELFASTLSGDASYDMGRFIGELKAASRKSNTDPKADPVAKLARFLESWERPDGDLIRLFVSKPEEAFELYPAAPGEDTRNVFTKVRTAILMSGTLYPGRMYADILGMERERTILNHYVSPFPPENRLILGTGGVTTLFRERTDSMYQAVANQLQRISLCAPGNLAVFFPSYELLKNVGRRLSRCYLTKPLMFESRRMTKADKGKMIEELRSFRKESGAIMLAVLGGSMSEGVDYPGNMLSGICIVGLPLSPPTARVKALVRYHMKRFGRSRGYHYSYVFPAINKVLQAAGRPIRDSSDRAFVVLMDRRFGARAYRERFPVDFSFEMVDDAVAAIKVFVGSDMTEKK